MKSLPIALFFAALGLSLNTSRGMFAWKELLLIASSWLVMLFRNRLRSERAAQSQHQVKLSASVCIFFSAILLVNPLVLQQEPGWPADGMRLLLEFNLAVVLTAASLVFVGKISEKKLIGLSLLSAGLLLLVRALAVKSAPHPAIDVFNWDSSAADFLLRGLDPYSQAYTDFNRGGYDYAPGYTYWPAVLYLQTLSKWVFGDIRYLYVVADLLTAWSLSRIARRLGSRSLQAILFSLLWLSFPVSLYLIDESWVDVPFIACAALCLAFLSEKRWLKAGVFLGLFCSMKQYAIFFAILAPVFVHASQPFEQARSATLKFAGSALATALLMFVPFVLWDWNGFYVNTISSVIHQKVRWDALSFVPAFQRLGWFEMSFGQSLLLYTMAVAFSLYAVFRFSKVQQLSTLGFATSLTYGVAFLFGKTAFCNYYAVLAFFALFYWVTQSRTSKINGGIEESHPETG